jgi:diguanylate cyclase (GGDEF)-like protein
MVEGDELERATRERKAEAQSQSRQDADQTAADLDQTQADFDQGASDADQETSDADQRLAERDQHASDRDQAAADWEQSHSAADTPAARAHKTSRVERDATTQERGATAVLRSRATAHRLAIADQRDESARARDLTAAARDRSAQARDRAAFARDRAAEARERRALESGDVDEALDALRSARLAGAALRERSAQERAAAAADRAAAAADREKAAQDRRHAGVDELTGVFRRGTGELALTHEIERSRRLQQPLCLALIDIDGLKRVNDAEGHAAGDALLRNVANAITTTMRAYDFTVRWGGDEFVCALSNTTLDVAGDRITAIQQLLTALPNSPSISAGLAALGDDDDLEALVARADAALYRAKADRPS